MLGKWKKCVDKDKVFGTSLTVLSKAFDCLDHDLLTAHLNVHGYLPNRRQRVKIENAYSTLVETAFGVSQSSILRPLLLNIFLADLFFIVSDKLLQVIRMIILHNIVANNNDLIKPLEQASIALFQWFHNIAS